MAASLSLYPLYPVPGRTCSLQFNFSSGANYIRVWCAAAPEGSELRTKLLDKALTRLEFYEGSSGTHSFVPDVGGVYRLVVQEYARGSANGGTYEDDPDAAPTETKVGGEQNLAITVGERITAPLGANGDSAELVLWVFGDTIRATTTETHDERSPAIVNPSSARASLAVDDLNVAAALSALVNVNMATALGDPSDIVSDIVAELTAHFADTAVHYDADPNPPEAALSTNVGPRALPETVSALLAVLGRHVRNLDALGAASTFHGARDNVNTPLLYAAGDLAGAYAGLAEIWRAYNAHMTSPVHQAPDTTHTLTFLPPMLLVHLYFFTALATNTPVSPTTVNTGVTAAIALAGFRK